MTFSILTEVYNISHWPKADLLPNSLKVSFRAPFSQSKNCHLQTMLSYKLRSAWSRPVTVGFRVLVGNVAGTSMAIALAIEWFCWKLQLGIGNEYFGVIVPLLTYRSRFLCDSDRSIFFTAALQATSNRVFNRIDHNRSFGISPPMRTSV